MSGEAKARRKQAAKAEMRRRAWRVLRQRDHETYKELVGQKIREGLGLKQEEVLAALQAGLRYIALCCSRRAGKTDLLAKLIVLTLLDAKHNEAVFFVADTLQRSKGIIWKAITKLIDKYQLDWLTRENTGEIHTTAGAACFLLGLNQQRQAKKSARGMKAVLYLVDEAQDQDHLLQPLLASVGPALSDRRGAFIIAGTPGWADAGTWYEWVHGISGGFTVKGWTLRENEKFPLDRYGGDIEVAIDELCEVSGWTRDHPDYLRELCNVWAVDVNQLVCEYIGSRNGVSDLPESYGPHWRKVIGLDDGWDDGFAAVVVAANPYGPERVVLHAERQTKLDNDEKAAIVSRLVQDFETTHVVCDYSGGGKTFYETYNKRYGKELGCQIKGAKKLGKVDSVKVINTELRKGRLMVLLAQEVRKAGDVVRVPNAEALASEIKQLKWKDKEKGEVLTSALVRDDCFDAFRYAMVEIAPWAPRTATNADKSRDKAKAARIEAVKLEARREAEKREPSPEEVEAARIEAQFARADRSGVRSRPQKQAKAYAWRR